ncbi:NUDIX hydrolase [Halorarius halobius]|uniref:NUDIX hydrolase n=1 Tax=Halorarius halobius TaxID=2962671 RepID=UPI0020CC29AD|nr:NUDIX hydrolase [Halorarius halobius]
MMAEYGRVVNVDGVVVRDGEYLLVERSAQKDHAAGVLAFPGGKLESTDGDAIAATARRELAEEVGIEVGAVEYVHASTFEADDGTPCLNVVVRCEHVGGEAHPRATDEVAAVRWLTHGELHDHDDVPEFVAAYADMVEGVRAAD